VCDFNLSRVLEEAVVLSSVAATNPRWLAPEILSGKGYTFASDVYSFGIILWEFLTWMVPWHEYGPWQVVAMVTESSKRPEVRAAGPGAQKGGCTCLKGVQHGGSSNWAGGACRRPTPTARHPTHALPILTQQVPEERDLPTPLFSGAAEYFALMNDCWEQDPAARPKFAEVISRLRRLLAAEAALQRAQHAESPTKLPRGGGSDTPSVRSRPIVSVYDLSNPGLDAREVAEGGSLATDTAGSPARE
jgi:serine/threonine protein kinase